jgi:Flp pilus assembly protein TadG
VSSLRAKSERRSLLETWSVFRRGAAHGCAGFVKHDAGSSILEFSIALSLLLLCAFGILECSMALYADHFVANAAKEATRYAMVRGSSWSSACSAYSSFSCTASSADVASFVNSIVPPGIDFTKLETTTTWPGTDPSGNACDTASGDNSPTCVVSVQVIYSFNFFLPFLPTNALVLTGSSSEVITE